MAAPSVPTGQDWYHEKCETPVTTEDGRKIHSSLTWYDLAPKMEVKYDIPSDHTENRNLSLVAVGPHGYFFVGCESGIHIYQAPPDPKKDLERLKKKYATGFCVHAVGLEPGGLRMFVVSGSTLHFYDVINMISPSRPEAAELGKCELGVIIRQAVWATDVVLIAITVHNAAYVVTTDPNRVFSSTLWSDNVKCTHFDSETKLGLFGMMDGRLQKFNFKGFDHFA